MQSKRSGIGTVVGGTFGSLCSNAGGSVVAESVKKGVETFATTAATSGLLAAGTAVLSTCTLTAAVPVLGYAALLAGSLWWQHREDQQDDQALREHFAEIAKAIHDVKAQGTNPAALELAAERIEAIHNRNRAVWAMLDGADKADIASMTARQVMDGFRPHIQDLLSEIRAAKHPDLAKFDFRQAFTNLQDLGSSIHFEVTGLREQVEVYERARQADSKEIKESLARIEASLAAQKQPGFDPTRAAPTPDDLEAARIVSERSKSLLDQAKAAVVARDFARAAELFAQLEQRPGLQEAYEIMTGKGNYFYAQGKFDDAIGPYEAAFALRPQDITARNNLAISLSQARLGNLSLKKQRAIEIHSGTLALPNLSRSEWARTHNNLGIAWQEMPTGTKADNLKKAIDAYKEALKEYTREAAPMSWAMTQNNLGNAWQEMPTGTKADNLKKAIDAYKEALKEYTREAAPMSWAATQNNLGNAWAQMTTGDKYDNLTRAIEAFNLALKVYTREAAPMHWAMTQNNLGSSWALMPTGNKADNLRKAIAAYTEALKERTREAAPMEWALTQNNVGNALAELAESPGQERCGLLRRAIACSKAALQVFTGEAAPHYHEEIAKNIAIFRSRYESLGCDKPETGGPGAIPFDAIAPAE